MNALRQLALSAASCCLLALVSAIGCAAAGGATDAQHSNETAGVAGPGILETKALAEEAFLFGLPIVKNYAAMYTGAVDRRSGWFKAPFNQLGHEARVPTWKDTAVVTPNGDTLASVAWLDLRVEPIVLSLPAVERSRYVSVVLCDGNTDNYGSLGTRTTGGAAGDYLVVGPGWTGATPEGIAQVFRSGTWFSRAGFRTQLFDLADLPTVAQIQAGYAVRPLSAYLELPAPPAAPVVDFPKIDKQSVKSGFFEYLDFALQFAPAAANETDIRAKLARLGVGAGKTFDFADLSTAHKLEVGRGVKDGEARVVEAVARSGKDIRGWRIGSPSGDSAQHEGNWLLRAAAAQAGMYGDDALETMSPDTRRDGLGKLLDCSAAAYNLTFPKGQLPPVNAFWSLTLYDGKTQLLIENPIDRSLINSRMLPGLRTNPDGSLTIAIRQDSPGEAWESNWLPAPDGPVYLVLRMYLPRTEPPSILPAGSGSWSPPGLVKLR